MLTVGILSLQGSVVEHLNLLNRLESVKTVCIKYAHELDKIDGLIIPGGESTTMGKLLKDFNIFEALKEKIENGLPIWGTCAGLILLSKFINGEKSGHLEVMDIDVMRNAYGSQINSFTTLYEHINEISNEPIPMVFIRAPYIIKANDNVKILKVLDNKIVAARQNNMLVTAFHPELTENTAVHEYFISMIRQ